MKNNFDLIVLLQSYPNLINAVNYIFKKKEKKILILVNGDKNIYKYLKQVFNQATNIMIKLYGDNIFLKSGILSRLLPFYVTYLYLRIPIYNCKEMLITYGNWCNVGSLFYYKINSQKIINLIAYEEARYTIKSLGNLKLPLYIKLINFFTNNLVERKKYFKEEDGVSKFINRESFGLVKQENIYKTINAKREREYHQLKDCVDTYKLPFILYIEKNILKANSISYLNFLKLNISIYRLSKNNQLPICVKFKPTDKYFFRKFFYKLLGFKILSSHLPAQLYSIQDNCKFIIGFSSSSMAENYGKSVYSFGSIKTLFFPSVNGNIESLRQRSYGNDFCVFLETRKDLENIRTNQN
tara:strand:+ start:1512 stop:2573 length:1062 start_codon:yes stop_codon:yes gene_type:complete